MVSSKFIFENSLHSEETFFPSRCDIFRFFELYSLAIRQRLPGAEPVPTVLRKSVRSVIIDRFFNNNNKDLQGFIRGNRTGQNLVRMTQEPRKISRGSMSRTTLQACAFSARFGNWSVFIPDPRLGSRVFIHFIHSKKKTLKPFRKL